MARPDMVEPWLRGTLVDTPAVGRAVVHALDLAVEDVRRWCGDLRGAEWNARPWGLPSPGFQLRHMARSLDRLLTYAEGRALSGEQGRGARAGGDRGWNRGGDPGGVCGRGRAGPGAGENALCTESGVGAIRG